MKRRTRLRRIKQTISEIFDPLASDLSYISSNPFLLKKHILFINKQYSCKLPPSSVPDIGNNPIKTFINFEKLYKNIYDRWMHMIKSCYDKSYPYYPYFGGKSIFVSRKFLNAKYFCIWSLKHKLITPPFTYKQYLFRKDKTLYYSQDNCIVIDEKDLHESKSLYYALMQIRLIRSYEIRHDPTVSYMSFYTRYFMYDTDITVARTVKYDYRNWMTTMGFSPVTFYRSVADSDSCSETTFLSRIKYTSMEKDSTRAFRPYDMLKPEFSLSLLVEQNGNPGEKNLTRCRRKRSKYKPPVPNETVYTKIEPTNNVYQDINNDVYKTDESLNPYGE